MSFIKKIIDRAKKGVRDIGSGAKDIVRNNPEALAILAGLGFMGGFPGGKSFGLPTFFQNMIGAPAIPGDPTKPFLTTGRDASGIFKLPGILKDSLGKEGIVSIINAYLAKKQFDKEAAISRAESEEARRIANLVNERFGSEFGGDRNIRGKFEDLVYNPADDARYDYYDKNKGFKDYEVDEEGIVLTSNTGGIAQLKMGGFGASASSPFKPHNKISGMLPVQRARGGNMNGSSGIDPQIFDPRMSGKQMMNEIKDNPGITQFFPPKFGMIDGPGGPKDDKIPAMLSDGEFVFTAKAVDNAGGPQAMYKMMNKLDPESSKGRGII